jgi:hypothetical protein
VGLYIDCFSLYAFFNLHIFAIMGERLSDNRWTCPCLLAGPPHFAAGGTPLTAPLESGAGTRRKALAEARLTAAAKAASQPLHGAGEQVSLPALKAEIAQW